MQKQIYYIEGCRKPQVGDIDGDQVIVDVTWGQQVPSHPHDGDTWEVTITTEPFLPKSPVVVNIDVATGIHIGETLSK